MKSFLFTLFLFIYASASAVDGKTRMEWDIEYSPSGSYFTQNKDMTFFYIFIQQVKLAFGEINTEDIRDYDFWSYLIILFTLFFVTLLMMNLLIGIISDQVGKFNENRMRTSYYQLCMLIIEVEAYLSVPVYRCLFHKFSGKYLVYAQYTHRQTDDETLAEKMATELATVKESIKTLETN